MSEAKRKPVFVFHDRYSATGRSRPNPATVCKGPCEGMGIFPVPSQRPASEWEFRKCPDCGGTGRRP